MKGGIGIKRLTDFARAVRMGRRELAASGSFPEGEIRSRQQRLFGELFGTSSLTRRSIADDLHQSWDATKRPSRQPMTSRLSTGSRTVMVTMTSIGELDSACRRNSTPPASPPGVP